MTARALTAGMLSALSSNALRPVLFYEGEFVAVGSPSEVPAYLRLFTGVGTITWNGYTWTGGGTLLGISAMEESRDLNAKGFTISLSGMPSALIATALAAVRQGRPGTVWLGLMDDAGALIADPYQLQRGRFDITVIDDDGEKCTIAAQYESRLIDLERPRVRYYTTEDQAIDYPSDLGFAAVPSLQDAVIEWG